MWAELTIAISVMGVVSGLWVELAILSKSVCVCVCLDRSVLTVVRGVWQ